MHYISVVVYFVSTLRRHDNSRVGALHVNFVLHDAR